MNEKQEQRILRIRFEMYKETLGDLPPQDAAELSKHLQQEYAKCDKHRLLELIDDMLLDSFGS